MFREQAISFTIAGVVQSIATIALALNGFAYWSLLFGTLAGAIIDLMLVTYFSKVLLMPSWRLDPLRPIFAFSRFTLGERLLWYLVQNTDTVAIGRLSSTHELGVFSIAKQLSHLPLDKIGDISSTLTVAGFSRIQHDNVALVRAVQRLVLIGSTIGFPLFWGLLIVSPAAVPIVLGKNWIEATPVIQAFCVALPLRAIWTLLTRALVGMGRPDVSFQNQALWLLIVLPAIVVGSTFGSTEVAAAWSISFPILFLISSFRIAKVLESSVKSVLAPMLTPAFAAGLMIAVTAAQSHLMRDHDPLSFLLLALPSAVLTFVIAVRVTSKDVYTELTSLIKSLAGARQQ
jgi:O-antigen/teichoic acid export membrane protein